MEQAIWSAYTYLWWTMLEAALVGQLKHQLGTEGLYPAQTAVKMQKGQGQRQQQTDWWCQHVGLQTCLLHLHLQQLQARQ